MTKLCKHCGHKLVLPIGPKDADILIAGSFPGYKEIMQQEPWASPAGRLFKKELRRVGINFEKCRVTNLWLHTPTSTGTIRKPNELYPVEYGFHFGEFLLEHRARKAVLVVGKEACESLGVGSVRNVAGTFVYSESFPETVKVALAMHNPALSLSGPIGELRLALERFSDALD